MAIVGQTGLSTNNATLVALVTAHEVVRIVSNGENVRWKLANLHILVLLDVTTVVNIQKLIWVHCH